MIDIRPDPAHPRGGYAVLRVDGAELSEDTVTVEVFDLYSEKFLGDAGWQPEKHAFGPYPVSHDGGSARIVVGPEIVDQLEEFATLRLAVGPVSADVSWPDEIVHSPKAATSDSAIKVGSAPAEAPPAAPIRMAEDPVSEPSETDADDTTGQEASNPAAPELSDVDEESDTQIEAVEPERRSPIPVVLGGVITLGALAAAAYFFLGPEEDTPTEPAPPPVATPAPDPEPQPPVAARPDPCGSVALSEAATGGFAALGTALRGCGGSVSADLALGLVEASVAEGDADALAFFGTLYDAGQTDPVIEDQIGLSFGDDPARAAEYYARARDAGSAEALDLLAGVCRALLLRSDTLSVGAREDYCEN